MGWCHWLRFALESCALVQDTAATLVAMNDGIEGWHIVMFVSVVECAEMLWEALLSVPKVAAKASPASNI